MTTENLLQRMRRLESKGQAAEAVDLLVQHLNATKTITTTTGTMTAPDYPRQMAAVEVAGQILGPDL